MLKNIELAIAENYDIFACNDANIYFWDPKSRGQAQKALTIKNPRLGRINPVLPPNSSGLSMQTNTYFFSAWFWNLHFNSFFYIVTADIYYYTIRYTHYTLHLTTQYDRYWGMIWYLWSNTKLLHICRYTNTLSYRNCYVYCMYMYKKIKHYTLFFYVYIYILFIIYRYVENENLF